MIDIAVGMMPHAASAIVIENTGFRRTTLNCVRLCAVLHVRASGGSRGHWRVAVAVGREVHCV